MSALLFLVLWAIPILSFSLAQVSQSVVDTYPIANRSVPLYPPPLPFIGKYQADIKVGSQTLRAILDTGSADTWFFMTNTTCLDSTTLQPVPPQQCGYGGPRYSQTTGFDPINDNLNITYGSGELINGPSGYAELEFGGIPVPKQQISLASYAKVGFEGKNVSGLIGLAYPGETLSYTGTNSSNDVLSGTPGNPSNRKLYSPILTTIFDDNLTEPVFAFALSRSNASGGILTIGGIPELDSPKINATLGTEVTVPIEKYPGNDNFIWYLTTVDGFKYNGANATAGQGQYFVDTGTSVSTIAAEVAQAYNALFDPPAVSIGGFYVVQCNATVPEFGVVLGGKVFYVDPRDMVGPLPESLLNDSSVCVTGVQAAAAAGLPNILGNIWLRSVLAIFDVGKSEMTFLSRQNYEV